MIKNIFEELRINVIFDDFFPCFSFRFFNIGSGRKCEDHESSPNGFTPGCTSK